MILFDLLCLDVLGEFLFGIYTFFPSLQQLWKGTGDL